MFHFCTTSSTQLHFIRSFYKHTTNLKFQTLAAMLKTHKEIEQYGKCYKAKVTHIICKDYPSAFIEECMFC